MWKRVRGRLSSAGAYAVCVAWLLAAIAIAAGPLGVEPRRSNLWVVMLIFWAPVVAMLIAGEVLHRIKNGPPAPGRHEREAE